MANTYRDAICHSVQNVVCPIYACHPMIHVHMIQDLQDAMTMCFTMDRGYDLRYVTYGDSQRCMYCVETRCWQILKQEEFSERA